MTLVYIDGYTRLTTGCTYHDYFSEFAFGTHIHTQSDPEDLFKILDEACLTFHAILQRQKWATELTSILPRSALINFLDAPLVLYTLELIGAIVLWCRTITPADSRTLFSKRNKEDSCCLDRFKGTPNPPTCLGCRYKHVPHGKPRDSMILLGGDRMPEARNQASKHKQGSTTTSRSRDCHHVCPRKEDEQGQSTLSLQNSSHDQIDYRTDIVSGSPNQHNIPLVLC